MIFLLIIFLIFIMPFPIKLKFTYKNKKASLYFYNINITKKIKKNKEVKKPSIDKHKFHLSLEDIKNISNEFSDIKFKPTLNFKLKLIYGLNDAAETAICYGVISSAASFLVHTLSKFFNISCYKIDIEPKMNEFILKMTIESIIFINFVKVIYIAIVVYIYMRNHSNFKFKHI